MTFSLSGSVGPAGIVSADIISFTHNAPAQTWPVSAMTDQVVKTLNSVSVGIVSALFCCSVDDRYDKWVGLLCLIGNMSLFHWVCTGFSIAIYSWRYNPILSHHAPGATTLFGVDST